MKFRSLMFFFWRGEMSVYCMNVTQYIRYIQQQAVYTLAVVVAVLKEIC
jgi:hypothetical protein